MLGIALGITVLITVLSVINGFDREIKKSIFSMMTPMTVSSDLGPIQHWGKIEQIIATTPGVIGVAPFISGQSLLQSESSTQPIMIIGIVPAKEKKVTTLSDKMIQGSLADLTAKKFGIILGENVAKHLGVMVGDTLTVVTSKTSSSTTIHPRFNRFFVTGLFRSGGKGNFSYESRLAFINLSDAQTIFDFGPAVTALHANVNDIYTAPQISQQVADQLSPSIKVSNWTEQLGDFFENIKLTKTILFLILILIILVAIFNLIATLVMVVNQKQADIAILRTMGATPKMIMAIFIVEGAVIGIIGTVLGVVGGIVLASNITSVVNLIQSTFHIQLISANMYFVNYLPSELQWPDVWHISLIALMLSLLATLRPAWHAAKMEPVEALRCE